MTKYFIDLKINEKTFHLGKMPYNECKELAYELNLKYKFIKRRKIQNEYERQNFIETEIIDVCEIYKEENLFTRIEEGTETQKTTD